MAVQNANN